MTELPPDDLCPGCFDAPAVRGRCPQCGFDDAEARPANALALGSLLDGNKYSVGRVLGSPGGFGITYLAFDRSLETRVAIKEYLPRDLATRTTDQATVVAHTAKEDDQYRYGLEQFLTEARTLAKLDHPNIVRVRSYFEANGTAYLVMDYYRGLTLAEYLDRQPDSRMPEDKALALLQPVLDGLRGVHARGFLHRDIKPGNIYLAQIDSGGVRPILLDFGAARLAIADRSRSMSVVLSPGYAPFEQYHRRGEQGPWTDVYGAAAVLYRMLTGKTPPDAFERQHADEMVPARRFGASVPVSDTIDRAMALKIADRPRSVHDFQRLLRDPRQDKGPPNATKPPPTADADDAFESKLPHDSATRHDVEPTAAPAGRTPWRARLWVLNGILAIWLLFNWFGVCIVGICAHGGSSGYGELPTKWLLPLVPIMVLGWSFAALAAKLAQLDDSHYMRGALVAALLAPLPYVTADAFGPGLNAVSATPFYCLVPFAFLAVARRLPMSFFAYFVVSLTWAHALASGHGNSLLAMFLFSMGVDKEQPGWLFGVAFDAYAFGGLIGATISFAALAPLTAARRWRRTLMIACLFTLALMLVAGPLKHLLAAILTAVSLDGLGLAVVLHYPWQFVFTLGLAMMFRPNTRVASPMPKQKVAWSIPVFGLHLLRIEPNERRKLGLLSAVLIAGIAMLGVQFHHTATTSREATAQREAKQQDDAAYSKAKAANTFAAYQGYLNRCKASSVCAHAAEAQTQLGVLYHQGQGVSQDDKQAFFWFEQAAQAGYSRAQNWLGWMYREGRGTGRSDTEAFRWLNRAAAQNDLNAKYWLARMHEEGRGTTRDQARALALYREAAAGGEQAAKQRLAELE
jgi:serine/threonine protein kinase